MGASGAWTEGPWSSPREKRPRRSGPERSKRRVRGIASASWTTVADRSVAIGVAGMALGHRAGGGARVETQAATGLLLALALERFTQVLHVVPPRTVSGWGMPV